MTTVPSAIACPQCRSSIQVSLVTPDYGFGRGVEFSCGGCQGQSGALRFVDYSPQAAQRSADALAASKARAVLYTRSA